MRVFLGQRYRFESEGQYLRLFRHGEKQPIFQTMNMRQSGGILEVQQLDVRPDDYQQVSSGVRLLERQISQSIQREGPLLGR
ncbi:hypothetical protein [Acaryochloris marina]|uniref:hypothetical protein n=1 Tax=Acaryochloris marina TaxID=155978 RepID=UPI0021C48485|nr:hypothetical protein [Acaryochloris marina]BDM83785.1 hypothetical protein AM10699_66460 [Acaryochloris marina MBIC10699]